MRLDGHERTMINMIKGDKRVCIKLKSIGNVRNMDQVADTPVNDLEMESSQHH